MGCWTKSSLCWNPAIILLEEYVDLIENLAGKLSKSPLVEYVDYSPLAFKSDFF